MPDIDLNTLLAAKAKEEPPTTANHDIAPDMQDSLKAKLTPEEEKRIATIKENLNLMDTSLSLQFGAQPQKNLSDFADTILAQVKAKDSGPVGGLLVQLADNLKSFAPQKEEGFLKKLPLIGSLISKGENLLSSYQSLAKKVEEISAQLERARLNMMKDIILFDSLYEKNLAYFRELELYILAGEEKLQELYTTTLPKLRSQAATSSDPMAPQVVQDFENNIERFEKKIHDLKISRTIAIQTAPQLRLIQNNDKLLVERIQSAIYNAIPLWKNQLIIALGLTRQQEILQMQRSINDTTNKLLLQNAEMLKTNTLETARENARSIVDIETVKKVNEDLISTIEETLKIQQESRQKRQSAEAELLEIESNLKNTLLMHSSVK